MTKPIETRSRDNPPDWKELGKLATEAEALWSSGKMTKEKYEEYLYRGVELVHGWGEYLECLTQFNPDPFSDEKPEEGDDEFEDDDTADADPDA